MNDLAGPRRIACLFFPLWPVQRLVVAEPALRRRCVVLFRRDPRRGQVVHAASPRAGREGVCRGMPLAEARSLVRGGKDRTKEKRTVRPPDEAAIRPADPPGDREALQELALCLHQFSPLVGLEESDDPYALLLDLSGLTHLFGGEAGWCRAVRQWLTAGGWHVRIAVADTVGAAWALACHAEPVREASGSDPLPGRFPDRLSVADDEMLESVDIVRQQLDGLPVEALRIDSTLCDALAEVGVLTVGQLRRLPRPSLAARFGDSLARRLDQLDGRLAEPIRAVTPPDSFTATQPLEYPLADRETLGLLVQRLVSQTAAVLARRQLGALRWRVALARSEAPPLNLEISLAAPVAGTVHLRQLVGMHLEQTRTVGSPRHPVNGITVTALECVRITDQQSELFSSGAGRDDPAELAQLVNRLAARLGPARVVRPQILADAQPEQAVRLLPLAGSRAAPRALRKPSPAATPGPLERPLRLLRDPLPVAVELDPAGRPWRVSSAAERFLVAHAAGPERIETGWWRAPLVRRDCWRIETTTRRRFWICHDLQRKEWFLLGVF